ncbi:MAG TPA: hypothetical protein EYG16_07705 [Deltaproteobacteria bacterium]|nr:hypothetical protein [Candidatus Binatota bacterium]HIL13539.1 hypothetical protein [Deltaproteobacteria bacterium]
MKSRSLLWPAVLPAAVLLWLPVLLFELVHPWTPREVLASPALLRLLALAAASAAAAASASMVAGLLVGGGGAPGTRTPAAAGAISSAAIAGCLLLLLASPVHALAQGAGWAPEAGYAALLITSVLLSLPPTVVLNRLVAARGAATARLLAVLAAGCWYGVLLVTIQASATDPRSWLLAAAAAGMLLWLLGRPLTGLVTTLVASVVVLAAAVGGRSPAAPTVGVARAPGTTNVVVFLVDTLRADHVGPGYEIDTTPRLDLEIRGRATVFNNAVTAAPSTIPSVKSLFSARRASSWGANNTMLAPPAGTWSMASSFSSAGYRSGAFVANGLVSGEGFSEGFDNYFVAGGHRQLSRSLLLYELLLGGRDWDAFRRAQAWRTHKVSGDVVVTAALDWISKADAPFFAYVHVVEPHWPLYGHGYFDPPSAEAPAWSHVDLLQLGNGDTANAWRRDSPGLRELLARYDEEVREGDRIFARLLDGLRQAGLRDNTLVVFTSDHGEEFFEHNGYSHGHDVFEEQVHVPLVFLWPDADSFDHMPASVSSPVSLVDLAPSIEALAGVAPPSVKRDGRSLLPLLSGKKPTARPVITETRGLADQRLAYREGRDKVRLIHPHNSTAASSHRVLVFDLDKDAGEQYPLRSDHDSVTELVDRAKRTFDRQDADQPARE